LMVTPKILEDSYPSNTTAKISSLMNNPELKELMKRSQKK
jgi:hypothetical protein